MNKWKEISIDGIAHIEKCVAEFNISELYISPYGYFRVKIMEDKDSSFTGYTNLRLIDEGGDLTGPIVSDKSPRPIKAEKKELK